MNSSSRSQEALEYRHLYKTAAWEKRRAKQLELHPLCAYHLQEGKAVIANIADHVIEHKGDTTLFFEGELQSLCASCHSSIKQQEEAGNGRRGADADGWPLDPKHPWNLE